MPAESVEYLKPFLKKLRDSFGFPLVVVRWNADHYLVVHAALDFSEKLKRLTATQELQVQYYRIKKIVGEFREHWDELIVEVKDKSGNPVKIVRHNGIEERSHR